MKRFTIIATATLLVLAAGCGRKPGPSSDLDRIRENADLVVRMGGDLGVELNLDRKSVEWLDGYIERNRSQLDEATQDKLVSVFGSFLGEAMVHTYGGEWTNSPDFGWGVTISNRITAFPFKTTRDHFVNGSEDSIASFFTVVPLMMNMPKETNDSVGAEQPNAEVQSEGAPSD